MSAVRTAQAAKRELIERLWGEGKSAAEVCAEAGIEAKAPNRVISVYRARGYDLPHRHEPDRVAASKSSRWPKCPSCGKRVRVRPDGVAYHHRPCGAGKVPV